MIIFQCLVSRWQRIKLYLYKVWVLLFVFCKIYVVELKFLACGTLKCYYGYCVIFSLFFGICIVLSLTLQNRLHIYYTHSGPKALHLVYQSPPPTTSHVACTTPDSLQAPGPQLSASPVESVYSRSSRASGYRPSNSRPVRVALWLLSRQTFLTSTNFRSSFYWLDVPSSTDAAVLHDERSSFDSYDAVRIVKAVH